MTDSHDRGISQSAYENPVRIFAYGPPIRTASYRPTFHHNKITRVYGPNVFIENKAVRKGVKCNLMKLVSMKM